MSLTVDKIEPYKLRLKMLAEGERFADTAAGTFPPRFARKEKSFESPPHDKQLSCYPLQTKKHPYGFFSLRRVRDSNSRCPFRHTDFPGLRTRPLCEPSLAFRPKSEDRTP